MQGLESSQRFKSPTLGQVHGVETNSKSPSPAKKRLRMKLRRNEIVWSRRDVILCLFKAVLAKEPHLKITNVDKNKAWMETKEMLFQQDCMEDYMDSKESDTIMRNLKVFYKDI